MLRNHRGFTIPELITVIVVMGILSTIVLVTYSGVQVRARDNKRQTDIETVAHYLEAEFQKDGQYPSTSTMTGSVSGVQAVLQGISSGVLAAPGAASGTNSFIAYYLAPSKYNPSISQYAYWTPDSNFCMTNYNVTDCGTFILVYRRESDNAIIIICGRGANVNNTKAIFPGPNGLPSFPASSCSNF